jgi:hypothetical protein
MILNLEFKKPQDLWPLRLEVQYIMVGVKMANFFRVMECNGLCEIMSITNFMIQLVERFGITHRCILKHGGDFIFNGVVEWTFQHKSECHFQLHCTNKRGAKMNFSILSLM